MSQRKTRQTVPYRGTNIQISFVKMTFKFRKVISCVYPAICGRIQNFIQIIRTSVIDKIAGYIIYVLVNSLKN